MQPKRGAILTILAMVFVVLAIQDFLKPFHLEGPDTAIVIMGHRFMGRAAYLGWAVAAFLLIYASGIWRMRRYALLLGYLYAIYVVLNIVIFTMTHPAPTARGEQIFGILFSVLAVGGAWLSAIMLTRRRADLV